MVEQAGCERGIVWCGRYPDGCCNGRAKIQACDILDDVTRERILSQGWQPMSTAPRDGMPVLCCFGGEVAIAQFDAKFDFWNAPYPNAGCDPDCWMPLPEPPKEPIE